jgi:hypothetical protein
MCGCGCWGRVSKGVGALGSAGGLTLYPRELGRPPDAATALPGCWLTPPIHSLCARLCSVLQDDGAGGAPAIKAEADTPGLGDQQTAGPSRREGQGVLPTPLSQQQQQEQQQQLQHPGLILQLPTEVPAALDDGLAGHQFGGGQLHFGLWQGGPAGGLLQPQQRPMQQQQQQQQAQQAQFGAGPMPFGIAGGFGAGGGAVMARPGGMGGSFGGSGGAGPGPGSGPFAALQPVAVSAPMAAAQFPGQVVGPPGSFGGPTALPLLPGHFGGMQVPASGTPGGYDHLLGAGGSSHFLQPQLQNAACGVQHQQPQLALAAGPYVSHAGGLPPPQQQHQQHQHQQFSGLQMSPMLILPMKLNADSFGGMQGLPMPHGPPMLAMGPEQHPSMMQGGLGGQPGMQLMQPFGQPLSQPPPPQQQQQQQQMPSMNLGGMVQQLQHPQLQLGPAMGCGFQQQMPVLQQTSLFSQPVLPHIVIKPTPGRVQAPMHDMSMQQPQPFTWPQQ